MATKREELKAFKKLKKTYPKSNTSLTCYYFSWKENEEYSAYISASPSGYEACVADGDSPMTAVDRVIERRNQLIINNKPD